MILFKRSSDELYEVEPVVTLLVFDELLLPLLLTPGTELLLSYYYLMTACNEPVLNQENYLNLLSIYILTYIYSYSQLN